MPDPVFLVLRRKRPRNEQILVAFNLLRVRSNNATGPTQLQSQRETADALLRKFSQRRGMAERIRQEYEKTLETIKKRNEQLRETSSSTVVGGSGKLTPLGPSGSVAVGRKKEKTPAV
jgi:hypothetical protein